MGANKHNGPRAGSRAYRALVCLQKMGPLTDKGWMNYAAVTKSARTFSEDIIEPLTRWNFVGIVQPGLLSVTRAGLDFLDEREPEPVEQGPVIAGRYVHGIKPLSQRHRPSRPMREGALDYRDIPSRQADVSVPFKSSIKLETEQG